MKKRSIKKLPPELRPKQKFRSIFRHLTADFNAEKIYPNDPRWEAAEFDEIIVMNKEWAFPPPGYEECPPEDVPKSMLFL